MLPEKVVLDLGLGAGTADRDPRPVLQFEDQHFLLRNFVPFDIAETFGLEIFHSRHLRAQHFRRRVLDIGSQEPLDRLRAFGAFEHQRAVVLLEVTELGEDFIQKRCDRQSLRFGAGGNFAKHDHGAVAVFVANEVAAAVSVTFFAAEDVIGGMLESEPASFFFA